MRYLEHLAGWRRYVRFWGPQPANDVESELRFHFDMRVQEFVAQGMSESDAAAAVTRRMGDLADVRAECRTVAERQLQREAHVERLDGVLHDIRLAIRTLAKQKMWTAVVVITLALGIGANSALFTVAGAVLLHPLPYPHPDQIVSVSEQDGDNDLQVMASDVYDEWRRSTRTMAMIGALGSARAIVSSDASVPQSASGARATLSYFELLGVAPERGRIFTAEEDRPGGNRVVVLSDQLWHSVFGGDSSIVGKTIRLDDVPTTVVGVMPPSFVGIQRPRFWLPLQMNPVPTPGSTFYYTAFARLRPGASLDAARAELATIEHRLGSTVATTHAPPHPPRTAIVMPLHVRWFGDSKPLLLLLLAAVAVLLLIACANVSNLLLARAAHRHKEFALRTALGASRWRLIRALLCESLVLSFAGGLLGLLIPLTAVSVFVKTAPGSLAKLTDVHVSTSVFAFTFLIATIAGVVIGLAPALGAGRGELNQVLGAGMARASATPRHSRLRRTFVIIEFATALVLLTVAGLLTRSLVRVLAIDPGVAARNVLIAHVNLPGRKYTADAPASFFAQLSERVRHLPSVQSVGLADAEPLGGRRASMSTKNGPKFDIITVDSGYFATVGTFLQRGRTFDGQDRHDAPRSVILNATMARAMFADANPIGRMLGLGHKDSSVVVGVVKDVIQQELEVAPSPTVFVPAEQEGTSSNMTLLVRTRGDPLDLTPSVTAAMREMDASLPPPTFTTLAASLATAVAPRRFSVVVLAVFAALAATLAAIGLYGVMAYLVEDRSHEIGVRIALGAEARQVIGVVVGQGMSLAVVGILIGAVGAASVTRLVRSMMYQVSVYDPTTFAAGALLLGIVACVACYIPARRATRVDPVVALRGE